MHFSDPFEAMQAAIDIVGTSPHPENKVAATLFGSKGSIARTNYWPQKILVAFGKEEMIGNSSGTMHAETACILQSLHATQGMSLCVTDPFCPNCAKNIAEAGIKNIYIDHKGFDKDFFQRRAGHFQTLSMQICEKAGINVYELWRKDKRVEAIHKAPDDFTPVEDSPVFKEPIEKPHDAVFKDIIAQAYKIHERRKFALAFVRDDEGQFFALTARAHAVTGFSMGDPDDLKATEETQGKYSLFQEPINRILIYIRRYGLRLHDGYLFCSQVPTSREQVNLVGADIHRITIGDTRKCRDPDGLRAMAQLSKAGILSYA